MNSKNKLFISGGGHAQDTRLLDRYFVSSLKNRKILYIPVGLERSFTGYDECYEWITSTLSAYSEKPLEIEMWVNLHNKSYSDISDKDAVYIGGAKNSYTLMREFKETEFIDILKTFLEAGGSLYGGSTGAIITGKYISTFGEIPPKDYNCDEGLGLIGNMSIFCHHTLERKSSILNFLKDKKLPLISIPESSGAVIQNNTLKVIGFSPVTVFIPNSKTIVIDPEATMNIEKML
ncbi:type 1 glutamine amidotransferase-like domain-containing protein [candidate division WWE3 bacterium]|uniref:Type 1 glutamine amidotransferase-like domain-containing protein n=1 Tax=candidate division WWE3 bacterium TaxID=2053526 RepID=A0A7X9E795_UNCKA|nr:type 1 glutamine amidotransferase-like domain-containing protein [candidate division WWE3 bacterium]